MILTRFSSGTAMLSIAVASILAGCSSIEPTATAGLTPRPATSAATAGEPVGEENAQQTAATDKQPAAELALAKTGDLQVAVPDASATASAQASAKASQEMAPQIAYATANQANAATATAAVQTLASSSTQAPAQEQAAAVSPSDLRAQAIALDEEEPTPDMQALQTIIPTPRPPVGGLAYLGEPKSFAALASLDTGVSFPPAPGDPLPDTASASPAELSKLIKRYAGLYGVPESLIHRVVHRESRYDPKAYHKDGYWGLMQIKYATAKSMGYSGPPEGLLDAETNLKYAVKYLRGAWLVADNSNDNAIRLYARGYYFDAKRKGMLHLMQ